MKKVLCALLCAFLLLPFAVSAESGEDAVWSLEGNVLCISGRIETAEVYPWADAADSVKTLRVSDGVTEIPEGAFRNFSKLQYLTLPDSLRYIDASAFEDCASLCWLKIPDGLIGIGEKAFAGCTKLSPVYLPESVAWIGDRAFDTAAILNCYANSAGQDYVADNGGTYRQTKTHELAATRGTWGSAGTWTLAEGAMVLSGSGDVECDSDGRYPWDAYRADIQTVELGEGITSLGKDAFALCRKLTKISFPASIEAVDDGALSARAEVIGFSGTAAETFAVNRGLRFTALAAPEADASEATEPTEETAETELTEEEAAPAAEPTEETATEAAEETVPTVTELTEESIPTATEATEERAPAASEAAETSVPTQTEETEETEEAAADGTESTEESAPAETETPEETTSPEADRTEPETVKEPVLSVQTVTAQPGQTVQLTVALSENPGLCGLYFGLDYDRTKLTLEDYSCPNADFAQGDWMVGIGGQERAVWLQPDQTEAEGEILTLTFRVASDVGTGNIPVALTEVSGVDSQAGYVAVTENAGGITVALGVPGDVNGDGAVTQADLLRLRRYLSGQDVTAETGNADLNGDGKVDLLDLMLLQLLLAGQQTE